MKRTVTNLFFVALPLLLGLVVVAILIVLVVPPGTALGDVLQAFWNGAFRNLRRFSGVLVFWIPLTLVGIGLVITFRAGLWNIGVEGQMTLGGLFAAGLAFMLGEGSPLIIIPLCIFGAMLGGVLWASIAAFLKVRFGVSEIFSGVALNAIANQITLQLIAGPWKPGDSDKAQYSRPVPEAARLLGVSQDFNVSVVGLIVAVVAVIVVLLVLARTRWGLNLKAVGKNPRSALLLGVPTTITAFSALMVCGALAGIAGSQRILFTYGDVRGQFAGGIGFLGLLVVLLVSARGVWVPLIAFVFAIMLNGGTQLQFLNLDSSLTGVLQGALVLAVLLANGLRDRLRSSEGVKG
jgi:simple sugar transport system permease protein